MQSRLRTSPDRGIIREVGGQEALRHPFTTCFYTDLSEAGNRMDDREYDYHGLVASTWDVWRDNTENWSDALLFRDIVRQYGEPVLDIGCGTGRILLDYLSQGVDVEGLDNSPEMLTICQSKARARGLSPVLHQQRIEDLDLPRRYGTILGPSSVLQLVTDPSAVQRAMGRIFAHLHSGGACIASFAFEWREGDPLETDWRLLFEKKRPEDGAMVRSWTREWCEPARQLWHSEQRFEVELNGGVIDRELHRSSPGGRWYTQAQAAALFRDAGLVGLRLLHEFTQDPAQPDDRLFCVLGVKP